MQDDSPTTEYLPARRLSQERILEIAGEISRSPAAWSLGVVPLAIAIVNDTRQIVYANARFAALANADSPEAVLGKRPGEALGCLHAFESPGGCDTTRFCQYCGAANAIVKSLGGQRATQECAINRKNVTELDALNLQVWACPMDRGDQRLVLNSILDIAHEKALRTFERIFFHDVMNAVSGIKGIHEIIAPELPDRFIPDMDMLRRAIEDIQNIIETQQDFLSVETKEYTPAFSSCDSREVLSYLASYCQSFTFDASRTILVDPASPALRFSTDLRILQRVMVNMIKNALEATRPGEAVTLGCEQRENGSVVLWVHNEAVLPRETEMRLFQKGYSTKGSGRGFGTYSMRLFARQCLGGDVDFESAPESGTRFFITLPA